MSQHSQGENKKKGDWLALTGMHLNVVTLQYGSTGTTGTGSTGSAAANRRRVHLLSVLFRPWKGLVDEGAIVGANVS